ncbi:DNA repair protein RecN [Parvicella tangerina]|uniref:DNA repair protein RecN n=1 Tax=Parvicella tangerina TaxID=2829795 RepID=A0A916JJH3_9FLAO|nr:DNA repair protein RecN [Parvicella tangerina]CAG5077455.1 DNA repair protein RecN [Parvicella tangerina]
MLQKLLIQNFALIDHLQMEFGDGFSVITGETGSGKSILLGALGLILGDRFDHSSIRDSNKKCIIEGVFQVSEKDHLAYFKKFDLDFDKETIIRREINTSGKSRAFINDSPVSLSMLKDIATLLVDIHSQHETLMINNPKFIIDLIDSQLDGLKELDQYRVLYEDYSLKVEQLNSLVQQETAAQNQKDFTDFLIKEFEEYDLEKLVQEDIEDEYKLLSNAEEIKRKLDYSSELLNGGQADILSNLKQVQQELNGLSSISDQLSDLATRITSSLIELQDIANECAQLADSTELDERKLSEMEEKISFLNRLMHKHQLSTPQELLEKYHQLKSELDQIDNLSEEIKVLQKDTTHLSKELSELAKVISKNRRGIASHLQKEARELLQQMNMKNAEIDFRFQELNNFGKNGVDQIQLYVKTNLGGTFEPLKKIASGGETSRIMLAIKSLQSKSRSLPTIIFDEIDTGVSGEVANRMGTIMSDLGTKMQVISITHLPQIASKGTHHFKVYKKEKEGQTHTNIEQLSRSERVKEIAELMSGSDLSEAAIRNAEELLGSK